MNKNLFILLLFLLSCSGFCQLQQYKFVQIDSLQTIEKKNTVIFFQTDWCKFCKAMKSSTFKNQKVIEALNNNFYFIDFDAEQKEAITFDNKIFTYKNNGTSSGIHEIAVALATENKQINFPAVVILNPKNEIIFRYNGFLSSQDLKNILEKLRVY
jgi:thioredoxin-related protein